jgi:hypothetical protein
VVYVVFIPETGVAYTEAQDLAAGGNSLKDTFQLSFPFDRGTFVHPFGKCSLISSSLQQMFIP